MVIPTLCSHVVFPRDLNCEDIHDYESATSSTFVVYDLVGSIFCSTMICVFGKFSFWVWIVFHVGNK